jgi:hypothetical protein
MKSYCLTLAALAAIGFAGAAYAGEAKQMSDSKLDRVTAGAVGEGVLTARQATGGRLTLGDGILTATEHGGLGVKGHIPGSAVAGPGFGRCTAGRVSSC